jgi:uncharacterized membrane protein SpoIIM required for sporulation
MTPKQFEADHTAAWDELEALLALAEGQRPAVPAGAPKPPRRRGAPRFDGARLAMLYRRCCEHLALAQARDYPIGMTQRLEGLTQRAHQQVYRRRGDGLARFKRLVLVDIPQAVRAQRLYVLVAALLFVVPTLALGYAAYRDPGFILHLLDVQTVQRFDEMYGSTEHALGRERDADTDWQMFGHYIMNNIGIGFQCFASGIFVGLGSVFFLAFNGAFGGVVAGYLTARGHSENFYSFVVTHGAFELTAIVLAGAAGLRLGAALLAPGRLTRLESLKLAAQESIVVVYGVFGLLVIAAGVEAFWSSSRWVAPEVKYGVGAACWVLVFAYLGLQGRPPRAAAAASVSASKAEGPHAG